MTTVRPILALIIAACSLGTGCAGRPARALSIARTPRTEAPIILVHGFGGWGRDDIPEFYYWGGTDDVQQVLRSAGYNVQTASVGPFSSNWDRACELYAFIAGGRVDYGAHHSQRFGHERYGRHEEGAYPQWSRDHPVHIIAHSMGGQTARLLAHLLRHGDEKERIASGGNCSDLFVGGEQKIRSITTMSTPHDGTSLVNDIDLVERILRLAVSAGAATLQSGVFPHFDLKMDQWGVERNADEPLGRYFARLRRHPIWSEDARDFSLWDVSPEGARALNRRTPAEPDVYYFSCSSDDTMPGPVRGHRIPNVTMLPAFVPGAVFLGSFTSDGPIPIDRSWWKNDGVVNTVSMRGPTIGSSDEIVEFGGSAQPGIWNHLGTMESTDHADIIGIPNTDAVTELYLSVCSLVSGLEAP